MKIKVVELNNSLDTQVFELKQGAVITNFVQYETESGMSYAFVCIYDEKQKNTVDYNLKLVYNNTSIPQSSYFVGSKFDGSNMIHLIYWI